MGRLSARSNPTGLKELDRKRVAITVTEVAGKQSFTFDRLDIQGTNLQSNLNVIVIARAGNTNIRYELGKVENLEREPKSLDGLDKSQPLRFRVILHEDGNPKLAASIENLRARDNSQSESLLPMEPAELGERLWKLVINEDGPILQFNSAVFPSANGAENFTPFGSLVLPEALRQVMVKISEDPACLDDEGDTLSSWGEWLDKLGVDRPQEDADDEVKELWCDQVIDRFCIHFQFASRLQAELLQEGKS